MQTYLIDVTFRVKGESLDDALENLLSHVRDSDDESVTVHHVDEPEEQDHA